MAPVATTVMTTTAVAATGPAVAVASGPSFRRLWLDERSWVDVARGWLDGADGLYESLSRAVPWRQGRLWRYEKWVPEARLTASVPRGPEGAHLGLVQAGAALRRRYRVSFDAGALSWYRDGRDGIAAHRDRELRYLDDTVVAVLT